MAEVEGGLLAALRSDAARLREGRQPLPSTWLLEALLFDSGFQAVVLYRLARRLRERGVPALGPLVARLGLLLTGADISPAAAIGPGLRIGHGNGLVVGGAVRIGRDAFLLHQVTIGASSPSTLDRMPVLGDRVFVGAGAKLIGAITVGDGAVIGVNAVVTRDVKPGARLLAPLAVEAGP